MGAVVELNLFFGRDPGLASKNPRVAILARKSGLMT